MTSTTRAALLAWATLLAVVLMTACRSGEDLPEPGSTPTTSLEEVIQKTIEDAGLLTAVHIESERVTVDVDGERQAEIGTTDLVLPDRMRSVSNQGSGDGPEVREAITIGDMYYFRNDGGDWEVLKIAGRGPEEDLSPFSELEELTNTTYEIAALDDVVVYKIIGYDVNGPLTSQEPEPGKGEIRQTYYIDAATYRVLRSETHVLSYGVAGPDDQVAKFTYDTTRNYSYPDEPAVIEAPDGVVASG